MRYIVCSNDLQKLVRIASLPTAQTQSKRRKKREREEGEGGGGEKREKKGNKKNQIIKVRHLLDASQFACYKPLVP